GGHWPGDPEVVARPRDRHRGRDSGSREDQVIGAQPGRIGSRAAVVDKEVERIESRHEGRTRWNAELRISDEAAGPETDRRAVEKDAAVTVIGRHSPGDGSGRDVVAVEGEKQPILIGAG